MTDFDKIIKEKAESSKFEFKNTDWRKLKKKAGIKSPYALPVTIAIATAVAVSVGILTFLSLNQKSDTATSPISDNSVSHPTTIQAPSDQKTDTADFVEQAHKPTHEARSDKSLTAESGTISHKDTSVNDKNPAFNPKKITRRVIQHGRPLIINVDTIKDDVPSDEELRNGNSRIF